MNTQFSASYLPGGEKTSPARARQERDFIDYRRLTLALWRARHVMAIGAIVAAVAAFALFESRTKTYTATAQVLLTGRQGQIINIENVIEETTFSDSGIVSEIAIVRSRPVLLEVAARLDLARYPEFNPALREKSLFDHVTGALRGLFASESDRTPPPPEAVAAGVLAGKVDVAQFGQSYVLEVGVTSLSPQRAADIANAIAEVYIANQVKAKLEANARATEWLADNERDLRLRVESVETDLERRRAEMSERGRLSSDVLEQQRQELAGRLIGARAEKVTAEARATRFDALVAAGNVSAAMQIVSSQKLVGLVVRRDEVTRQRDALARRTESPTVENAQIEATIDDLDRAIDGEIAELSRSLYAGVEIARQSEESLRAELIRLERSILEDLNDMVEMRALERDVGAQRGVYERFLNRLVETQQRGDFQEPDARIVSVAVPPVLPSGPGRSLVLALAMIAGAGGVATWALARDMRREVFRTAEDVEQITGVPAFAMLPKGFARSERQVGALAIEAAIALRRLVSLVDAARGERGAQVLVISSVLPEDGASEIAAGLAQVCGEDGARVALVDCLPGRNDLLKRLAPGDALVQSPAGLAFKICRVDGRPEGRVEGRARAMSPGARAELLRRTIDALRDEFDRVIVCIPSSLASADMLVIGRQAGAVLLALTWESTPQGAALDAVSDMERLGIPMAGFVLVETDFDLAALYGYAGEDTVARNLSRARRRLAG